VDGTSGRLVGHKLKRTVQDIVLNGRVEYTRHLALRLVQRGISVGDILNCLQRGAFAEDGIDKYIATYQAICTVFALETDEDGKLIVVVTAYRS